MCSANTAAQHVKLAAKQNAYISLCAFAMNDDGLIHLMNCMTIPFSQFLDPPLNEDKCNRVPIYRYRSAVRHAVYT